MSPPILPPTKKQPSSSPIGMPEDFDAEMKWKVLNGKVKTGIADAGASASCGRPEMSNCGKFEVDGDLFNPTGRKSTKIFQYAGGAIAAADTINEFKFDVHDAAKEVHMVPGIKNTLVSTNQFALANYATIFTKDMVHVYDMNNTKIEVSRSAVLKGWRVPKEGLWRIPLENDKPTINKNTALVREDPLIKLRQAPPKNESINSVYKLKTKPELIRYYHAAAGFPTHPTWLAAINNNHITDY